MSHKSHATKDRSGGFSKSHGPPAFLASVKPFDIRRNAGGPQAVLSNIFMCFALDFNGLSVNSEYNRDAQQ